MVMDPMGVMYNAGLKTWNVIKQGKLALMAHQICMEGKMGWEMVHVREEILGFQVYLI
jgi:hypothetical protein